MQDKKRQSKHSNTEEQVEESKVDQEKKEGITEDVDAILDEIDDVLESNAEDFVKSFIQKGGQ